MIVYETGEIEGTIGGGTVEFEVIRAAIAAIATGESHLFDVNLGRDLGMCCGGEMKVFIEPFAERSTVHLFGAGHVSKALAALLATLEFRTVVYDDREELLQAQSFPAAKLVLGDTEKSMSELASSIGRDDAVIIFTHLHDLDFSLLSIGLPMDWGYMGLIGSKTKIKRFELRLKSGELAGLERWGDVSAPIGLDIGSKKPAEIAVSISAELISWRCRG
jgi:xanthine dehydrogenase accessory factor